MNVVIREEGWDMVFCFPSNIACLSMETDKLLDIVKISKTFTIGVTYDGHFGSNEATFQEIHCIK